MSQSIGNKSAGSPQITPSTTKSNVPKYSMPNYSMVNLVILCIVGLIIKVCFSEGISPDGETGPATSTIWGYGIAAVSVFFITFINYAITTKNNILNKNSLRAGITLVGSSLPSIFTLILLIYMVWLNVHYFKLINMGKVADEFYDMSKMSNIILFFQIFTLFKYLQSLNDNQGEETNDGSIIYLLSLINIIFIIILNIILEYFSTDG
mgnify:CR=1 FL=1